MLRKVKNLFLQSNRFARGQTRKLHPAFRDLELAAQSGLAKAVPPALGDFQTVRRHLLKKPTRNERLFAGREFGHEGVQRRGIFGAQIAL